MDEATSALDEYTEKQIIKINLQFREQTNNHNDCPSLKYFKEL